MYPCQNCMAFADFAHDKRSRLTLYRPRLHDVIHTVTAKLIQEGTANQRKLSVRHSVAAKLAAKTFMISNIGLSSFLLNRLGVLVRSVSYKRTRKLRSLLILEWPPSTSLFMVSV